MATQTDERSGPVQPEIEIPESTKRRKWGLFTPLDRRQKVIVGVLNFIGFVVLWEVGTRVLEVNPFFLPPLSAVFEATLEMHQQGVLWDNLWISGWMYAVSMIVSIAIAIPAGLAIGAFNIANRMIAPYMWALYTTPRIILLPLVLLWVGINDWARIVLIVLSAVPPILVVVMEGVKTVDNSLLKVARSFGGNRWSLFRSIVLPSTLPFIGTGIRMGVARGLIGLFVAELFTAANGIGYVIVTASRTFDTSRVFSMLIIFIGLSVGLVSLSNWLERRLSRWNDTGEGIA